MVALGGGGPAGRDLAAYQRGIGLAELPKFSAYPEVEIETLLGFQPDLVLDDFALDEPQATKIAAAVPVFAFREEPGATVDWRVLLRQMASVFGAEAKAESHIAAYDARVAAIKERLQARWAGASFAYVGPYGNGTYYIAQANMTTNQVMHDDLGFAFAKAVPPTVEERQVDVSMEKLDELSDADLLLPRTNPKEDGTGVDEKGISQFTESKLWQRLPAVRKKQSYLIDGALLHLAAYPRRQPRLGRGEPSHLTSGPRLSWRPDRPQIGGVVGSRKGRESVSTWSAAVRVGGQRVAAPAHQ